MPAPDIGKVRSDINVTPLVDVVLVLLIIFMVVMPMLQSGPAVELPAADDPPDRRDDGLEISIALAADGSVWIGTEQVEPAAFERRLREVAAREAERPVVIRGDAALSYGTVKSAILAVKEAGFKEVGLIAERRDAS